MTDFAVSRRNLIKGAGATAVAAAGLSAFAGTAVADEAAGEYTFAETVEWQAAYDVVVLGMGFSGMISAMEAADAGATVLLCEKCPEGEAGGNSRVCGQMFAYGFDDPDNALTYYTALAASREVPEAMLKTIADGVAGMATTMSEKFGMNADEFMDCTEAFGGQISPEYPELPGADGIHLWATHQGVSDSYLYQSIKARLTDNYADKIDVWFETPATALIQDPETKTVVGVTVDRKGETRNVRANNGVCVCTGGFEDDAKMVQDYLGVIDYAPIGGLFNTGDGIKMCMDAGARLWHMKAYEGAFGMNGCGYYTEPGLNAIMCTTLVKNDMNTGAVVIVGTWGKRFGDESFEVRHGHMPTGNGIWENPHYPEKIFAIWDKTQYEALTAAELMNANFVDTVTECATIADAAAVIGCDETNLQETIDDFNFYCEQGKDYEFNRPAETLRAFDGEAYYVMPMKNLILNTQGGPERNENAEILDQDGNPIPHLYSAGEMGGITSCMYQGGTNVAECFIFGQLAGANAATAKDPLPAYTALPKVECTPATLGAETDLGASDAAADAAAEEPAAEGDDGAAASGELTGVGKGIGGDVPVTVTLDADGKIASVEVGDNSETQGIGSNAIEQLPEQFVGLSTAEEIDALDGVSGATITSNALKDAVKQALGL